MSPTDLLLSAIAVSAPTFGWVLVGLVLRRVGLLRTQWGEWLALFTFHAGMPLMLFLGAATVDYRNLGSATYLWAGVAGTGLVVVAALAYGWLRGFSSGQLGIFVQCAYRSNLGIVGIALAIAAYGDRGLQLAALPVALMTVLYNIIAVILLNATLGGSKSPVAALVGIARNPLVIGINLGILYSVLGGAAAPVTRISGPAGSVLLPLALVSVGAAMNLSALRQAGKLTAEATLWRLCVAPALGTSVALLMGVRGEALGVLFLLLAGPVAAASYVMVVAARGDGPLAANLVVVTTLFSAVTVTLGIFALNFFL